MLRIRPLIQLLVGLAVIAALYSCGGGDGGGNPAPPPLPPPPAGGFGIDGVISVSQSTAVDSDVNDVNAAFQPNDTPAQAQVISNPVTLGGYVNRAGYGADGRSFTDGDLSDYFRVALVAGETITLLVANPGVGPGQGDVDLYLWDASGTTILLASLSAGPVETLTVPSTGEFLIEAFAFPINDGGSGAGSSNYVLGIGQLQPASTAGMRLGDEFISGDMIVKFRSGQRTSFDEPAEAGVRSRHQLEARGGAPGRSRLLRLRSRGQGSGGGQSASVEAETATRMAALPNDEFRRKYETLLAIKAVQSESAVDYAEPNYLRRPLFTPNDQFYDFQWHFPLINLPVAWDTTLGNPNVTVAVVDTGVLMNHPDFSNQAWIDGYDFISEPQNALDGDGIDPIPDDPGDGGNLSISSFHGTHVAGTVGAATDNSTGVAGVAPGTQLMPLRVCGLFGCSSFDTIEAVLYAAGLPNSSGETPSLRADVINLSLGGGSFSEAEQDAFDAARAEGVVVVAAAGNESSTGPSYPAAYAGVISVSAVGIEKSLAGYSNTGPTIDVAAPGGDFGGDVNGDGFPDFVLSTGGDDSSGFVRFVYPFFAGTSMASPHVAGVIALMKSVNANLTPAQIDQMLVDGELTDDIGVAGRDDSFGYGLINAQKAVAAALNAGGSPPADNPTLGVTPGSLNLGLANPMLEITLRNVRTGSLQVNGISIPAAASGWLSVSPLNVDADGLGTYAVTVDRTGLVDGTYSATITAQSTVNDVPIPVIMQVSSVPLGSDVGYLYILLVDQQTGDTAAQCSTGGPTGQCEITAANGEYVFIFVDVPPGSYEIIAGTDSDNDFLICDSGEACGAYLTFDQPLQIDVVDTDLTGIDFAVGHAVGISAQGQATSPSASDDRGRPRPR